MKSPDYFQEYLSEELARRCERNPRYSIRAFSKALGVDVSSLSRILSGKQTPSYKICEKIFLKIAISPKEQQRFLVSVAQRHKAMGFKRLAPAFKQVLSKKEDRLNLSTDLWRVVADWYHGAIMELTLVEDFKSDPKWIAHQLGISDLEAKLAIKRLIQLKLLREENGVLVKTYEQVTSGDKNITTPAHKRLQNQVLKKAIHSLENDAIEIRNMTSMSMAIDQRKIPQAKLMIQKFSRELCAYLESGNRTQVYQLGICLYPISKSKGD